MISDLYSGQQLVTYSCLHDLFCKMLANPLRAGATTVAAKVQMQRS